MCSNRNTDKLLGENICAFVKCNENTYVSEQELKEFCKGKIAAFKQVERIIIIDELNDLNEIPKGPTKKTLYRKLKSIMIKCCEYNSLFIIKYKV